MPSTLPPPDYAALVRAVDRSHGPCTCPYLVRLGMMPRCDNCCQKIALLAEILAATDTNGRATIERWTIWAHHPALLRLLEPVR